MKKAASQPSQQSRKFAPIPSTLPLRSRRKLVASYEQLAKDPQRTPAEREKFAALAKDWSKTLPSP